MDQDELRHNQHASEHAIGCHQRLIVHLRSHIGVSAARAVASQGLAARNDVIAVPMLRSTAVPAT
eukprot:2450770-Prymnesium_polylepis.2